MYKTDALKSLLLKINPYLDIYTDCVKVTEENLKTLFRNEMIVCEAFDNPEAKAMLVNGILEHFRKRNSYRQPVWLDTEAVIRSAHRN